MLENEPYRSEDRSTESEDASHEVTLGVLHRQVQSVTDELAQLGRLVRTGTREVLAGAGHRVRGVKDDTVERAQEVEDDLADWIRSRPLHASLMSMGIGAILWSLLRRS